jgi:hypothetical protein
MANADVNEIRPQPPIGGRSLDRQIKKKTSLPYGIIIHDAHTNIHQAQRCKHDLRVPARPEKYDLGRHLAQK